MSGERDDQSNDELENMIGYEGDSQIEAMPVEKPRRAASLTLREDDARTDRSASMAAANQSLADALRIAYRGLQAVMVLLLVAFLLSGFQQVDQSEQGLRLRFGAVQEGIVEPGAHLSLPKGFGEIVRVSRTQQQFQITSDFMPASYDPSRDVDRQLSRTGTATLRPGADGSLITANQHIVHAQAAATYSRSDIRNYATNVHPDYEEQIVKAMVRRAMVHAFATRSIDDLLTRGTLVPASPAETTGAVDDSATPAAESDSSGADVSVAASSLEGELRKIVNRQAREAEYGIEMDSVTIGLITPPIRIRKTYQAVVQEESQARTKRENARERARGLVSNVAGTAAEPLLALMDEYERLQDIGDEAQAEDVLGDIFAVFDGDYDQAEVQILGKTYSGVTLGGRASEIVGEALRESRTMGDIARREAETFNAKLEQYRANPRAFLVREWAENMDKFLAIDTVQTFLVPPGVQRVQLDINNDPEISRQQQIAELRNRVRNNQGLRNAFEDNPISAIADKSEEQ